MNKYTDIFVQSSSNITATLVIMIPIMISIIGPRQEQVAQPGSSSTMSLSTVSDELNSSEDVSASSLPSAEMNSILTPMSGI